MSLTLRPYTAQPGFTPDFYRIHDFLVRINQPRVTCEGFPWGRWEWIFSLQMFEVTNLAKIGVWEQDGEVVALAAFEDRSGYAYLVTDPLYSSLWPEMLIYAQDNLSADGKVKVLIRDGDEMLQDIAVRQGFRPTQESEHNSVIHIDVASLHYALPEGYRVVSLADDLNIKSTTAFCGAGSTIPARLPNLKKHCGNGASNSPDRTSTSI
ncbi:MAG: hypothetical protein ACYC6L_04910 [Anaerolineae bacterium]